MTDMYDLPVIKAQYGGEFYLLEEDGETTIFHDDYEIFVIIPEVGLADVVVRTICNAFMEGLAIGRKQGISQTQFNIRQALGV